MTEYAEIDLQVRTTAESGRVTAFAGRSDGYSAYKPHLRIAGTRDYLGVAFVDGPEWIHPGDRAKTTVAFLYIETGVDYSPLVVGASIEVIEGTRIIAHGVVTRRWSQPNSWSERVSPERVPQ